LMANADTLIEIENGVLRQFFPRNQLLDLYRRECFQHYLKSRRSYKQLNRDIK
jgi:hypothetical protein